MSYPRVTDIIAAASDPIFIKDPFFQGTTISLLRSGRPEMYAGGFSQVFVMLKESKKWAFKVWHKEIINRKERYAKITSHLNKVKLPYFVNYEYVNNGILVNGQFLDTFRMEWIDGLPLIPYISLNLKNKKNLERLSINFLKMAEDLYKNSISHGDLQHENIFILENGDIKLIDYDSICVPALNNEPDVVRGLPPYQHPSRYYSESISSLNMDFFSEIIIYLSIYAIIENPLLWDKYKVDKSERLLFDHEDYFNFDKKEIRKDLNLLSDKVRTLVLILESYLANHRSLQPFSSII